MSRRSAPRAWVMVALSLICGCAKARNYDDPNLPVYSGGQPRGGTSAGTLRVVTFNLKWGRETGRAAELFSRPGPLFDADLIVLQEMDEPGTRQLAEALGLGYVYVPSAVHPLARHDFGVALLSPWPLEAPRKLVLPHQHRFRKLRRAATVATLQSPLGAIRVYGIHLESPTGAGGQARRDQVLAVLADVEAWAGPVVVAGDFNGRGGPKELAKAGFSWATESIGNTAGPFDFDHVLARGLCAPGPGTAGAAKADAGTSDHRPVWALLTACRGRATGRPRRPGSARRLSSGASGSRASARRAGRRGRTIRTRRRTRA